MSHIGSEVGATVRLNTAAVNVLLPWLESELFPVQLPVPVLLVLSCPVKLEAITGISGEFTLILMTNRCFSSDNGGIKRDELRRP